MEARGINGETAYLTIGFAGEACGEAVSVLDRMIGWCLCVGGRDVRLVAREGDVLTLQPVDMDTAEPAGDAFTLDLADGADHALYVY